MRVLLGWFFAVVCACNAGGEAQAPRAEEPPPLPIARPASTPPAPIAEAPPPAPAPTASATDSAPDTQPAPPANASTSSLKISAMMVMEGTLAEKSLSSELGGQLSEISRCAAIVRKTDTMVGSLNLQITVSKNGAVSPNLQSPVNGEAKTCIVEAAKKWRIIKSGAGKAMVLLTLVP